MNQYNPSSVSPPGDTIQDLLDEKGMKPLHLALKMGRPLTSVYDLIDGKLPIDEVMAHELEEILGGTSAFWIAREANYRKALRP